MFPILCVSVSVCVCVCVHPEPSESAGSRSHCARAKYRLSDGIIAELSQPSDLAASDHDSSSSRSEAA